MNVITTTKTVSRNSGEFTITTHSVGGYALIRTELAGLDHTAWKVHSPHHLPSVVDMSDFKAETPEFGVSWAALGTRDSVDARAYGSLIMIAADVSDVFNEIVAAD